MLSSRHHIIVEQHWKGIHVFFNIINVLNNKYILWNTNIILPLIRLKPFNDWIKYSIQYKVMTLAPVSSFITLFWFNFLCLLLTYNYFIFNVLCLFSFLFQEYSSSLLSLEFFVISTLSFRRSLLNPQVFSFNSTTSHLLLKLLESKWEATGKVLAPVVLTFN